MKFRQCFIGSLFVAAIFVAGLAPLIDVYAQELSFIRGQKLQHELSVCLDKSVALAILDADSKKGFEAAKAIWSATDRCQAIPVVGPLVGAVVKSANVRRNGKTLVGRVVEIINDGKVIGYFFTTAKVERNT